MLAGLLAASDGSGEDEAADRDGNPEGGGKRGRNGAEEVDDRGADAVGCIEDQHGEGKSLFLVGVSWYLCLHPERSVVNAMDATLEQGGPSIASYGT